MAAAEGAPEAGHATQASGRPQAAVRPVKLSRAGAEGTLGPDTSTAGGVLVLALVLVAVLGLYGCRSRNRRRGRPSGRRWRGAEHVAAQYLLSKARASQQDDLGGAVDEKI